MTYSLEQLATFARAHVASKDIDPVYPVLRDLQMNLSTEVAIWHSLVYVAYYNIASAETAFSTLRRWVFDGEAEPQVLRKFMSLPTGTERRNLRTPEKMFRHLHSLAERRDTFGGSLWAWLTSGEGYDDQEGLPTKNWDAIDGPLNQPWGNGRWASYKTREVLWKVNGFPLQAPDTGMANSSGPRDGLALFVPSAAERTGNDPATVAWLEEMAWFIRDQLAAAHDCDLPIEEFETVLCDFHALADGRYYVGHDIDQMAEQLLSPTVDPEAKERILLARARQLPREYLGYWAVDRDRKRAFRDEGVILVR